MVATVAGFAACADDNPRACVSNDVGEVCAEQDDSSIRFNGQGLSPGSVVRYVSPLLEPITFTADPDGAFDPGNTTGVISVVADTVFTFDVSATDAGGSPLVGQIEISTG